MSTGDIHVGRVVLRGDASAVEQARATFPAALPRMHWPDVGDEIVVVRCLAVAGVAAELPGRAAVAAGELARNAADPWSPAADHANVVRFRSRLDYRACLVRDLLAGTAAGRWLWRHRAALLAQPTAAALAELLGEDTLALVALLERPALAAALPALWRTLDAPAAREVLHAIAAATGWGRAIAIALDPLADGAEPLPDSDAAGWRTASGAHRPAAPIALRPPPGLPNDLPPTEARVVLQSVLALWMNSPAALGRDSGGRSLREVAHGLARTTPDITMTSADAKEGQGGGPALARPAPDVAASKPMQGRSVGSTPPASDQGDAAATIPGATRRAATGTTPTGGAPDALRSLAPSHRSAPPTVSCSAAPAVRFPATGDRDFHTRGGGLFFLLNVLNLPDLCDWRAMLDEPQAGWRELVRFARSLDFSPDPPLAGFLADACALAADDDPAAALVLLPVDAGQAAMQCAALRHYGEAALRAALAERPARVLATCSHVDVHLRLSDANLDIRRTGLDLDPGWLPWLGRVVRFHYDSGGFTP
ncbi:hypothetical protein [Cupriavidus consociatus]|uniref:hypothetical protein n=1 Tax=Cupriavidus consociatus TaxID=2821357 RepID=UPI001AE1C546|nr:MULTISPECIES: hypothetical protein [unclassified Cupriavidus]MBP0622468.1 hypothetical protein [Cupriavidus sp. LEh25]MDK2659154.1 hypothetical protein [Cupriavidus sp. LEh21]